MRPFRLIVASLLAFSCGELQAAVNTQITQKIIQRAQETHTDRVIIYKEGDRVVDYTSNHQSKTLQVMSVTKSFVGLAIGLLIDEGKIPDIKVPVANYFPEWASTPKKDITIQHILSHTSGIQSDENSSEVGDAEDVVKLALNADLETPPGTVFKYNSKAINILSGLVKKITGKEVDQYINEKIF